jgi:hypothetical protein
VFTSAFTFYPLPQERKSLSNVSGFADDRPANSVVHIFKGAANDSPSPGGSGEDLEIHRARKKALAEIAGE